MFRAARSAAAARVRSARQWVVRSKLGLRARAASIPSWVIVLALSAVVGAGSAVITVTGFARLNRSVPAIEVPVTEENVQEGV